MLLMNIYNTVHNVPFHKSHLTYITNKLRVNTVHRKVQTQTQLEMWANAHISSVSGGLRVPS